KAASDHLVRAYHHTYGLPTLTTNCSNNYGPFQFPEKLIPLMILNALDGKALPVYGDGQNVRDWLYVGDHCAGIRRVLEAGRTGASTEPRPMARARPSPRRATEWGPAPRDPAPNSSGLPGNAPGTDVANPSTRPRSKRNSAGRRPRPSRPASARRSPGFSRTR